MSYLSFFINFVRVFKLSKNIYNKEKNEYSFIYQEDLSHEKNELY